MLKNIVIVPVGHICKFDLEQYEQRNVGVKWNFLATIENLRNTR